MSGALMFVASAAGAATILVTPATLISSFASARAGDTLRLVGSFGPTKLQDRRFASLVTLDATRAVFTDTLALVNVGNVTVYRGKFDITAGSRLNRAASVYGSSNVSFASPLVYGTGDDVGIQLQNSTDVSAVNGRFDGLRVAIGVTDDTGGTVTNNRITHAVVDGIDIASSHFVTASENSCSLGTPAALAHPDCIQMWSTDGQPVQSDITVTHNYASGATQGFTSFGSGGGGLRLTITGNVVDSSYPQGIACYYCVDSNISYNSVSTLFGAAHITNINVVGGSNNIVEGNIIHPRVLVHPAALAFDPSLDSTGLIDGGDSSVGAVPEPGAWAMLLAGFAGIGLVRRRAAAGMTGLAASGVA